MRAWMGIGPDPRAIALIGAPVDKASVMVGDEHGPLRLRQLAHALLAHAAVIENDFMAALAIGVGAGIDRIRQYMIDGDIAGVDPAHAAAVAGLQRKRQPLAAKPQPNATHRSERGKSCERGADGATDGFIGVKADIAILLAPDEAHGKAAPQFAARRLVADAAVEAGTQHMQFGLAHSALEAKQQAVVEQRRVIDAVGVADQRVSEAAEIDEAVPIGIVAG